MSETGIIRGKVWKFGDNISTTDITPKEMFMAVELPYKEMVFAAIRPDWKDKVKTGDCIVGGENFGFGSSRSSANDVMKDLKLGCVVADSFARIFYRNSIAIGFPIFSCPGVSQLFSEGDEMELDLRRGLVRNLTTGQSIQGKPYPQQLFDIMEAGGMMPLLVARARGR